MFDTVITGGLVVDGTGDEPVHADVAITDGIVTAVGTDVGPAARTIDADGRVVAPGWVDVHTHYDGQVTWDPELTPSSWHGATTVVMGNCGVGFAPVRPGGQGFLIELMEAVEDIPGTALHEGIDWQWESFGEYLDALESTTRAVDVAAQIPHVALRAYVLGERAHEDASAEEVAEMARLVTEAAPAGAVGFSTSRTILHSSKHGFIPGTTAPGDELRAIADAMAEAGGRRVFQLITDQFMNEPERSLIGELARRCNGPLTYTLAQADHDPVGYLAALDDATEWAEQGVRVAPQVASRPTGMLFGLRSSLHPFVTYPSYRRLSRLPLVEQVAQLRDPVVRAELLADQPSSANFIAVAITSKWHQIYRLGQTPDYEPPASSSAAAVAAAAGVTPQEVVLDWLLEEDGHAFLFAPLAGFTDGNLDSAHTMMTHPTSVVGLGDGGAHCGLICDASMTTYLLTHWVRDRVGTRLSLQQAVHLQAQQTAELYGFSDRGTLEVGKRADVNIIDMDRLRIAAPEMINDLPANGRRLIQRAEGYDVTMVKGQITFENGVATGARPGGLVRAR